MKEQNNFECHFSPLVDSEKSMSKKKSKFEEISVIMIT